MHGRAVMAPVDRNRRSGRARGPAAPPIPVFPCRPERTLASRPERASREWGAQLAAQRRNPLQGRKKRFGSTAPWRRAATDAAVTVRADALTPWGGVASSAATASPHHHRGPGQAAHPVPLEAARHAGQEPCSARFEVRIYRVGRHSGLKRISQRCAARGLLLGARDTPPKRTLRETAATVAFAMGRGYEPFRRRIAPRGANPRPLRTPSTSTCTVASRI